MFHLSQTLSQKELIPIMTSAKVNFEYKPDEECEESTYASYQHNNLERFFLMFTYVYFYINSFIATGDNNRFANSIDPDETAH